MCVLKSDVFKNNVVNLNIWTSLSDNHYHISKEISEKLDPVVNIISFVK